MESIREELGWDPFVRHATLGVSGYHEASAQHNLFEWLQRNDWEVNKEWLIRPFPCRVDLFVRDPEGRPAVIELKVGQGSAAWAGLGQVLFYCAAAFDRRAYGSGRAARPRPILALVTDTDPDPTLQDAADYAGITLWYLRLGAVCSECAGKSQSFAPHKRRGGTWGWPLNTATGPCAACHNSGVDGG